MSQDTDMREPPTTAGADDDDIIYPEPRADELDPFTTEVRVLPGATPTSASFEFTHEDHTLGNALRHIIMKNPAVEFCGYSIPHPAEDKMHLRIQTYGDDVHEVLDKGLTDLMELCDVVLDKFEDVRKDFKSTKDS